MKINIIRKKIKTKETKKIQAKGDISRNSNESRKISNKRGNF